MILTVTLNPALDLTYTVDALMPGTTHRVREVVLRPGGKGVNVSRVLHTLRAPVLATGLLGGANGGQVVAILSAEGLDTRFVPIAAECRRTVVVTDGRDATGFWEPGPHVLATEWEAFLAHYRLLLSGAAVVVLAGSLPAGLCNDAYAVLVTLAREAGIVTLLDTEGPPLLAGLEAAPTVVKPNAAELATATGHPVDSVADACIAARGLRAGGPTAVVTTLGATGLVASTMDGQWFAAPPAKLIGNPTGAGDACVAALAAGLLDARPWPELLADAVACSAASVNASAAGSVDVADMRSIRPDVVVKEI